MFNNISWQGYWTVVALLSASYYLIIYLFYYRSDFKIKIASASLTSFKGEAPAAVKATKADEEYLFDTCLNELAAFFEEAKATKWVREALIYCLQRILKKYVSLKNSSYEESLRKVIVCQAEDICSIHLNEEDVVRVLLADE